MPNEVPKEQGQVGLLDADPGLGEGLSPEQELQAREQLLAPVVEITKGPWEPPEREVHGHLGYLVLSGLLMREVTVGKSRSVELLNTGDLLRPWQDDPSSYSSSRWSALEETALAALEPDLAARLSAYPTLVGLLIERTISRARNLAVHSAIANTVGLEKRILMLFQHLAERGGRVTREGVALQLRITHQMVADLVGARRPSATSAIVRLAEQGSLTRTRDGGWLLRAESTAARRQQLS